MIEQQKQSDKIKEQRYLTESKNMNFKSQKVLMVEDVNPPKSSRIMGLQNYDDPDKETVTHVTEVAESNTQYSADGSPSSKKDKHKNMTQKTEPSRKDTQRIPGFSNGYKETARQQEKDLKILQKCFNLSLERMQQNYEGSMVLQNKDGKNSPKPALSNWGSPLAIKTNTIGSGFQDVIAQKNGDNFTRMESGFSPKKRNEPYTSLQSPLDSDMSPMKPRTSGGYSRVQVNQQIKIAEQPQRALDDQSGRQTKFLRDLNNNGGSQTKRNILNNIQSPIKPDASIANTLAQTTLSPNSLRNSAGINITSTSGQYFSPSMNEKQQQMALHQSMTTPAKQHQFRKQLKLPSDAPEQHQLVLIESAAGGHSDEIGGSAAETQKGEITLKAVKMSRFMNQQNCLTDPPSRQPSYMMQNPKQLETIDYSKLDNIMSASGMRNTDDQGVKLKVITTQIPQSLLISHTARNLDSMDRPHPDALGNYASTSRHPAKQQFMLAHQQQIAMMSRKSTSGSHFQAIKVGPNGQIVNTFLLPTNQVKNGMGQHHMPGGSMPPSLNAINVQQTTLQSRDGKFGGPNSNSAKQNQLQQQNRGRITKKKSDGGATNSHQQMKLARRQIQFYNKRNAEEHMPTRTPKKDFCTERLLFKRRARLREQNLLIFYFDGVVGELCQRQTSYGYFKVRHGAFNGLRKLSYRYQIALLIPYAKKRAKVIACYIDKFQGCPVDAIYCVKADYFTDHGDLRFIDYKQIYEDFDVYLDERLIEKCLIIAPRTKEVSSHHNPVEAARHARLWQKTDDNNNKPEESEEDMNLLQMYLVNQEMDMTGRIDMFLFQGCPANLSPMLEPNKRKVNYLHTYEECMSPSQPRREGSLADNTQLYKGKQTATQANKIAVDLGQHQKPVTLFVPHSKGSAPTVMSSFQPIVKAIEDLALLDEHCKEHRDQSPLLGVHDSYESSIHANSTSGIMQALQSKPTCCQQAKSNIPGLIDFHQPFSCIDGFYAFKSKIVAKSGCLAYASLLKTTLAIETKQVQTYLYKDSMLGRVLLEKAEIKKCYQFTQQKHAGQDAKSEMSKTPTYIEMKQQNSFVKRYVIDYATAYYSKVKETMDDAKIMRMTAYFMNQFSQRLVDDKNKKPNQHLRDMYHKEINYEADLPSRNVNLFKNHRFLILVKSTGAGDKETNIGSALPQSEIQGAAASTNQGGGGGKGSGNGPGMETIDMAKIMGINYFRQLDQMRLGTNAHGHQRVNHPVDLLPQNIVKILFNQRHSDCTDWFSKKAFTKPIKLLEKQQTVQDRKELIQRHDAEKADHIANKQQASAVKQMNVTDIPIVQPVQTANFQRMMTTIENGNQGKNSSHGGRDHSQAANTQNNEATLVAGKRGGNNAARVATSSSPNKNNRINRGKTLQPNSDKNANK